MPVPVENDVEVERMPAPVEATAYFIVAEALTNVAKHARADHVDVEARVEDGVLPSTSATTASAAPSQTGSGLVGLRDRLAVFDGQLGSRPGRRRDGGRRHDPARRARPGRRPIFRPHGRRLIEDRRRATAHDHDALSGDRTSLLAGPPPD